MKENKQYESKSVIERSVHNLFYNNKYLAIFSSIAAVILWIVVVMEFSPETTYKIQDVPVVINIENTTAEKLDLQPFTDKEFKVDVTIKGKRYAINRSDLSPKEITVAANLNYVDSVGTHSLQLVATKNNRTADYEIVSISNEEIDVYFDLYKEVEIDLNVKPLPKDLIPEGYYSDGAVLSPSTVVVGGAATQIDMLDRENIFAKIDPDELSKIGTIKKTTHFNSKIDLVDAYGNIVNFIELKETSPVIITVPVMKKAEFATSVEFSNTPSNYNDYIQNISIYPETLNVCAAADVISSLENITVGRIDFSNLKAGKNVFEFSKDEFSTNLKIFDDVNEVTVTVNVVDVASKKVDIDESRISFTHIPDNYNISLVEGLSTISDVIIFGPESEMERITADSVYASINLTGYNGKTGRNTVTADISVNNGSCWAYGKYEIPIDVVAP